MDSKPEQTFQQREPPDQVVPPLDPNPIIDLAVRYLRRIPIPATEVKVGNEEGGGLNAHAGNVRRMLEEVKISPDGRSELITIIKDFDIEIAFGEVCVKTWTIEQRESVPFEYLIDLRKMFIDKVLDSLKLNEKVEKIFHKKRKLKIKGDIFYKTYNGQNFNHRYQTIKCNSSNTLYFLRTITTPKPNTIVDLSRSSIIRNEAKCFTMNHLSILPLSGWCMLNGSMYYVYEYKEFTLDVWLEVPRDVHSLKDIFIKLINGFKFLHNKGFHYKIDLIFIEKDYPIFGYELIDDSVEVKESLGRPAHLQKMTETKESLYLRTFMQNFKGDIELIELVKDKFVMHNNQFFNERLDNLINDIYDHLKIEDYSKKRVFYAKAFLDEMLQII